MKYEIGEVLNQAIMTNSISLIVEGTDDIKIYEALAINLGKTVAVFPIGCVEGYSPGCGHVVPAMNEVREMPEGDREYSKYILGIIDKDVKDFRMEIPLNPLILTLKYYSLESHFINESVIKDVLIMNTKTPESLLSDDFIGGVFNELAEGSENLFLLTLEALKCSLDSSYEANFQYGFSEGRIFSIEDQRKILEKKDSLLYFADSIGLTGSMQDLKTVTKGKWLIHYVSHKLSEICTTLHTSCGNPPQSQCIICETGGELNNCLYRLKEGVTAKTFKNSIFGNLKSTDLEYVKSRICSMI
ncbi:DUF4435 domain-containing protein [Pectobacterium punjabense]|uniref:DUF4435 domain-containing protein n=1 Tax=Pectobacterium punjabense TaxID=2108399 RepID=UPI00311FDE31